MNSVKLDDGLFEQAIKAAATGCLITDARLPDNPIIFANDTFSRMTGYLQAEIIGRNCRFLQGSETDKRVIAQIREAVLSRKKFVGTILNYRKDGSSFWNRLTIAPIYSDTNVATHFVGMQEDVTSEIKLEQRNNQLVAKLGAINDDLRKFARNTAHDLKSPIATAETLAEHFIETYHDSISSADIELMRMLGRALTNSRQLVDDALTEILNNTDAIAPKEEDLAKILEQVLVLLPHNVSERVQVVSQLPRISCFRHKLYRIFLNLITNAFNHGAKNLKVGHVQRSEYLDIFFSDDGPGIPKEVQKKIFNYGVTGNSETSRSGIGLALVFKYISEQGGKIEVESEVGHGTTMHLFLPTIGEKSGLAIDSGKTA